MTRELIRISRFLVLRGGIESFTVEDLAAQAGVSRRTFFNYFASKEHAVLGIALDVEPRRGDAEFVAGARPDHAGLVEDLSELVMRRLESYVGSAKELAELLTVLQRVPRLRDRAMQLMRQEADADVRLVEQREGMLERDPRARLAVELTDLLIEQVIAERLHGPSTTSFRAHFSARLEDARAAMMPVPPR